MIHGVFSSQEWEREIVRIFIYVLGNDSFCHILLQKIYQMWIKVQKYVLYVFVYLFFMSDNVFQWCGINYYSKNLIVHLLCTFLKYFVDKVKNDEINRNIK